MPFGKPVDIDVRQAEILWFKADRGVSGQVEYTVTLRKFYPDDEPLFTIRETR